MADEEALLEGLVKIKWIGLRGQCIWENKIHPNALQTFGAILSDGQGLQELVEDRLGPGEHLRMAVLYVNSEWPVSTLEQIRSRFLLQHGHHFVTSNAL